MALIDDLTRRISAEVRQNLDEAIRNAIETYLVGSESPKTPGRTKQKRKTRKRRSGKSAAASREKRNERIISAVKSLGEATIDDVAAKTGLDKRGVGSSLYYLSRAGQIRRTRGGKYKA